MTHTLYSVRTFCGIHTLRLSPSGMPRNGTSRSLVWRGQEIKQNTHTLRVPLQTSREWPKTSRSLVWSGQDSKQTWTETAMETNTPPQPRQSLLHTADRSKGTAPKAINSVNTGAVRHRHKSGRRVGVGKGGAACGSSESSSNIASHWNQRPYMTSYVRCLLTHTNCSYE